MNERIISYHILREFELTLDRLDDITNNQIRSNSFSDDEIRHIKNLTSGVVRNLYLLDWFAQNLYSGQYAKLLNKIKIVLRMGLYEILFMYHIPEHASVNEFVNLAKLRVNDRAGKMVNAILRSFLRQREKLTLDHVKNESKSIVTFYSFPQWLIQRWLDIWGIEFTEALCAAYNELPQFYIRINTTVADVGHFRKLLSDNKVDYEEVETDNRYFKLKQIGRLREAIDFAQGLYSVQDQSASIPIKLLHLKKKDTFLDVCAAPGGKFTQALEDIPEIKIAVAVDVNVNRLKKVKENLHRLKLSGHIVAADALNLPFKIKFKKILIDAPCSGQGVITKHPDIKWRRTEDEISEFSNLQKKLLKCVSEFLQKSGQLVYATCSIDPKENQDVIEIVTSETDKFKVKALTAADKKYFEPFIEDQFIKTFPHLHKMDGSFAAVLKLK